MYIDGYAFDGCYSLTIYAEATVKPTGWDPDWNANRTVIWVNFFTVNFNLNGGSSDGSYFPTLIVEPGDTIKKPAGKPTKYRYAFIFWALSTDLTQEYN